MTIKRILILAPLLVIVFLLQSYLWVPTYEQQTRGNPERLNEYIAASIGDASLLNPILTADTASSQIEGMVFEGLIDRDEELRFRGRLATSWEVYEEAYFFVNKAASIPGLGKITAKSVEGLLMQAKEKSDVSNPELKATLDNITDISVIPAREFQVTRKEKVPGETKNEQKIRVSVRAPARIKLTLAKVDQDLFKNLTQILGADYFASFNAKEYVNADPHVGKEKLVAYATELLPAIEHNPVLVFHLRPNVRFHDGHVFDANDVKFTYDAIMDPKNLSPRIADYEPVKKAEVIDPLTVRIVYKRLYSPAIGTWGMGILPEHLLKGEALKEEAIRLGKDPKTFSMRQSIFNRHPVGCGPFVFQDWKSDQYITLKCFDGYWEGPPNYKRYLFRIIPDLLTQEMEFYAGTIDSYGVQPHQVKRLKTDPRFQCFSGASFGYTYIGYNMRRAPFDDPKVRRALGMAIDVNKIIDYVLYGQGESITGPFVKQTDYYDHGIRPVPYDPQGSLKLLEEAGWKRNKEGWLEKDGKKFQFTLITNSGNDLRKAILAIAQDAWRQIGIEVRTDLLEWSVFLQERVDKADFDALILGWSMGIEPDLYQIWHSSQTNPHQLNFVGFKNKMADGLIIKIRQEYDREKQVKYCHMLHEIIAREQPYTFLYVSKWTAVLDKRIVIRKTDDKGNVVYKKITPTNTGNYSFHFNKWIKLPEAPSFALDG
ncbi:MAG: peptide ABC transporter substrate-binding protein [Deltaproteobacteria bacterium]|nr:peptide ABC transporter substrate-binding protein [Deltaproteobacteria bacterium]MBW1908428.1 peptide ABC transporter substrate-binding protein [Deltaproteobacteria bacterium]MBW2168640.1 peptide ABC transporter substrate-binding protein [Deltaproteobacteria bacterium]